MLRSLWVDCPFSLPHPDGSLVADQHQKEKPGADQARAVVETFLVSL